MPIERTPPRHLRRPPQDDEPPLRPARDRAALVGVSILVVSLLGLAGVGAVALWLQMAESSPDAAAHGATDVDSRQMLSTGPTTSTTAPLEPDGDPGTVAVIGDSLTATATYLYGAGKGAPQDVEMLAWQGWTANDAQPSLATAVAEGRADTVVLALGTNDSALAGGRDGWGPADVERFRQLLATPAESACVVVVLPGHGAGIDPGHAAEMDEARADLLTLAQERQQQRAADPDRGATVVVDWQAQVTARPQLLSSDGIHLARDPTTGFIVQEAAAARTGLYWHGVAACDDQ